MKSSKTFHDPDQCDFNQGQNASQSDRWHHYSDFRGHIPGLAIVTTIGPILPRSSTAEMNVIIICACVPTFLPLIQQLRIQNEYLAKKPQKPTTYKNASRRPLQKSVALQPLGSYTEIERARVEGRQKSLPDSNIRATKRMESQWEARTKSRFWFGSTSTGAANKRDQMVKEGEALQETLSRNSTTKDQAARR